MEFVKNLVEKVEKASKKQIGSGINSLHSEEVNPVLAFHYGVPSESSLLAFDSVQQILAVATRNGQIKLFGRDNTQALLQSENAVPSKFLKFMVNQGILLNVNIQNQIEVWDIESRRLSHVHTFKEDISSFTVLQQSPYIYVGDISGNVSLLKLDQKQKHLVEMPYRIPFSKSYGESTSQIPVMHILPQPFVESKRVLIIFKDGIITLWDIQSSLVTFTAGKNPQFSQSEGKSVISSCWACNYGSKVAIGYNTGDLYLYSVPLLSTNETACKSPRKDQNAPPIVKLHLGFKLQKVPVVNLKWEEGKLSRLYVSGFSEDPLYHSLQVIILNEASEARTVKLVLPLTEPCLQTELISLSNNKQKQNALAILLKSGRICIYDDSDIERYLHNCQINNKSSTLPSQIQLDLPLFNSVVTCAKLYTSDVNGLSSTPKFEEYAELLNRSPNFLSINAKDRDMKTNLVPTNTGNLSKNKSLYITGHFDGTINFWDSSSPLLLLIFSIKQQNGAPITSLYFDASSKVVISGDQNGLVRIITFKKDASDNMFSFLQAKPGENYTIKGLKLQGSVVSISMNSNFKHLAVGTDKGLVALINMEDCSVLYQKQIQGQVSSGIISMQFEKFIQEGFERNILLVSTEDSSVLAFEEESGNAISPNSVHTKNPSRALLMQILEASSEDSLSPSENSSKETASKNSLLLLCSENAVRLYSLTHAIQGIKKQISKKRLSYNCCYASIVHSLSHGIGLMLVFTNGKIEIRSLPDLNLLKETSLRGFKFSKNPNSYTALSASSDGDLIMVSGDQEISFFSTLSQKESYRYIESLSAVYKKDNSQVEESNYIPNSPKEKKMGLFGKVMKDLKGNKGKNNEEIGSEYSSRNSFEKLSTIIEASNFPIEDERRISSGKEDQTAELSIDDIDIDDSPDVSYKKEDSPESKEKNKAQQFAALSKQKFGKGLQVLKGKLKPKTEEKLSPVGNKNGDEAHANSVNQIKAKYGFATNHETSANSKMADNKLKLKDNINKLEGINERSSEMANSAQNFSSMANELLKTLENEKK